MPAGYLHDPRVLERRCAEGRVFWSAAIPDVLDWIGCPRRARGGFRAGAGDELRAIWNKTPNGAGERKEDHP